MWLVKWACYSLVIEVLNDIELCGLVLVRVAASVLESLRVDVTRRLMDLSAIHPASRCTRLLLRRACCSLRSREGERGVASLAFQSNARFARVSGGRFVRGYVGRK